MAATERLKDFDAKPSPVGADIIYFGDSSDDFNEVQVTLNELFAGYSAALVSIAGLTTAADRMIYTTASNVYAVTPLTAFARTLVDDTTAGAMLTTLGVSAFMQTVLDDANAAAAAVTLAVLPLLGGTMGGAIDMGSHKITSLTDPTSAQDAATKAYVDLVAQGLTVIGACRVATTGALTVTYANGASGVGATLTNAGAQAALSIDSVSLSVNDRVLVKNQASTLQNGVYIVTDIGSGSSNWIMTRATDYDQPSEIQPGDLCLINAGTSNANSSWVETATVTAIGTDPISFSQFTGQAASKAVTDNTKSFVASVNGSFTAGHLISAADTAGTIQDDGAPTGTGAVVRAASPTFTGVPILAAPTATSLTFTSTSGIIGTTTNDSAAAGSVGEVISSVQNSSQSVAASGTVINITSISLTAGDWDISAKGATVPAAGTTTSAFAFGISQTSAAFDAVTIAAPAVSMNGVTISATSPVSIALPLGRISLAGTTTIYLIGTASFAVSTMGLTGWVWARRAR